MSGPRPGPPPDDSATFLHPAPPPPDASDATVLERPAARPAPPADDSVTVLQPPTHLSRAGPPPSPQPRAAAFAPGAETHAQRGPESRAATPPPDDSATFVQPSRAASFGPERETVVQRGPERPMSRAATPPPDDSATFVQPPRAASFTSEAETLAQHGPERPTRALPAPDLPADLAGTVITPSLAQPPHSPSPHSPSPHSPSPLAQSYPSGPLAQSYPSGPSAPPVRGLTTRVATRAEGAPRGSSASGPGGALLEARPGDVVGGYEVERTLGRGGMGVVYLANDPRLRRRVALKVLPMTAATDEAAALRFKREAEALAALDHPGIRPVFGWGRDDHARVFWLAMGFVDGRPYDAVVTDEVGLGHESPRRAARVVRDAARALAFAHRRGVIHRDVKPSNIMLEAAPQQDGGLKVHVVDFGLARLDGGADLTVEGQVMGTLKFMPPEQALGAEASALSDVWSLGATLFWALTGQGPYDVRRIENLQLKVSRGEEPRRPGALRRDCPPDLEAIVLEALELEPVARYATADALADDLERWLAGEPVHARPPSLARRARGWLRARRAVLVPALALVVGGLVAAAVRRSDPELPALRATLGAIEGTPERAPRPDLYRHLLALELYQQPAWRLRLDAADAARVDALHERTTARLVERVVEDSARLDTAVARWSAAGPGKAAERDAAQGLAQTLTDLQDVSGVQGARALGARASAVAQLAGREGRVSRGPPTEPVQLLVPGGAVEACPMTEPLRLQAWGLVRTAGSRRPETLPGVLLLDPARVLDPEQSPLPPAVRATDVTRGLLVVAGPGDAPAFLLDPAPVTPEAWAAFLREGWSDDALWDDAGRAWRKIRHATPPEPGAPEVSLHAARAFARSRHLRLPTWAELQRAAGGPGWTAPVDPAGCGLTRDHREWTADGAAWEGARGRPEPLPPDAPLPFRCAADVPGG